MKTEPTRTSPSFILNTIASALLVAAVPYSYLSLEPINQKLEKKASDLASASITDAAAESGVAKEETTHVLVDKWATFNLGRTVMTGVAALAATWAALDRLEVMPLVAKLATGADRLGH
jgi:hypothetical protein